MTNYTLPTPLDVGRLKNKVAIKVMDNATKSQEEIIKKNDVISKKYK